MFGQIQNNTASRRDRQELAAGLVELSRFSWMNKADQLIYKRTGLADVASFASQLAVGSSPHETAIVEIILELVRKQSGQSQGVLLSLDEYLMLGHKREPNFPYDRQIIYNIAEFYQRKLSESGRYDEIDLARAAQEERKLSRPTGNTADQSGYELLVCDEIQDFTDIQTELLFDLVPERSRLFLAGDDRQIINPSGFRWEEIRQRFHEGGGSIPPITALKLNFRSTSAIVGLANALLAL
ncbi:MAG: hypothetical protein A2087_11160 [Spirochaetes bacterium GWD1_61_31]|nr:MAG: hypothetical protein A2Y37_09890 [Spirochaetes bacterium GWB1_60_80]OHD34349.1 MAG: hypothetical protein A2004_07805 [Spirochaetes bacterium GWC1_61_12]OHD43134.1 MAG: hypothetical protein A2087_11160 [Spirochaetes bacterium GWD1_61_31]OHD44268.1 MAG: hypothetical protein A2Y35_06955 [Spirochaetes bacterium GWE1_60_18]OHD60372.1 MAG: hypothetical protein A2Y32_00570 [Spirochaetes bacterium GWF1_60_12]HAW86983.1 hypothetical protein [Spirochaetaceae bacterium]